MRIKKVFVLTTLAIILLILQWNNCLHRRMDLFKGITVFQSISILRTESKFKGPTYENMKQSMHGFLKKRGLEEENYLSTKGSLLNPLTEYQNPCWMSKFSERAFATKKPYFLDKNSYIYTANNKYHSKWMQDGLEFIQYTTARLKKGENWKIRCLPGVFLAGVSKCGTSHLHELLVDYHPDIYRPFVKEPHWWNKKGKLSNYLDNYDGAANSLFFSNLHKVGTKKGLTIDSSSQYLYESKWKNLAGNQNSSEPNVLIAHYLKIVNPRAKALVIVRNPTERLFSHHRMLTAWRKKGGGENNIPYEFRKKVEHSLSIMKKCLETKTVRECAYNFKDDFGLHAGIYYIFLKDWIDVFGKDILVIKSEDFYQNRTSTLHEISSFLNISKIPYDIISKINEIPQPSSYFKNVEMLDSTRQMLDDFYSPYNKRLADLLRNDKFIWK